VPTAVLPTTATAKGSRKQRKHTLHNVLIACWLPPQVSKVPTAVLSTTAKAKERAKKKEAEKEKEKKATGVDVGQCVRACERGGAGGGCGDSHCSHLHGNTRTAAGEELVCYPVGEWPNPLNAHAALPCGLCRRGCDGHGQAGGG